MSTIAAELPSAQDLRDRALCSATSASTAGAKTAATALHKAAR